MQIVVRIVLILLVIFLIWLLRKWIRRIIFILILLCLAFFIYGIFSPSWASRLWYNVRTFPQRVTSRISDKNFLDYDSYKSGIKKVWDKIEDVVDNVESDIKEKDLDNDNVDEDDFDDEEVDTKNSSDEDTTVVKNVDKESKDKDTKDKNTKDKNVIKSFPDTLRFVNMPVLDEKNDLEDSQSSTSYSKSEILKIVSKYIENNLDEDTDILVTVEYEEDSSNVERIVLQTQSSVNWYKKNYVIVPDDYDEDGVDESNWNVSDNKKESVSKNSTVKSTETKKANSASKSTSTQQTTSNKLTTKEQKEAEEIFSVLF